MTRAANRERRQRDALAGVIQGHRYALTDGGDVLALKSGAGMAQVARIQPDQPYPLGAAFFVPACDLTPRPMRYFYGQIPA